MQIGKAGVSATNHVNCKYNAAIAKYRDVNSGLKLSGAFADVRRLCSCVRLREALVVAAMRFGT